MQRSGAPLRLPSCWAPVVPRRKSPLLLTLPLRRTLLLPPTRALPPRLTLPLRPMLLPLRRTPLPLLRTLLPLPPKRRRTKLLRRSKRLLFGLNGRADGAETPRLPPAVSFPDD